MGKRQHKDEVLIADFSYFNVYFTMYKHKLRIKIIHPQF